MNDYHTWKARLIGPVNAHDGDTITAYALDLGWGVAHHGGGTRGVRIRLTSSRGPINAPEVTGVECAAGLVVRNWVRRWLARCIVPAGVWVLSRELERGQHARDVYGRTVGELWSGAEELGAELLAMRYAKPCGPGGVRVPWTAEELRAILDRNTPETD